MSELTKYSEAAWDIASLYSHALASETRDLAAHIDKIVTERDELAKQLSQTTHDYADCVEQREALSIQRNALAAYADGLREALERGKKELIRSISAETFDIALETMNEALSTTPPAALEALKSRVREECAKALERRITGYVEDHGSHDYTTNVTEFPEWVETVLETIEEDISALRALSTPQGEEGQS